jgi:hypothetical protein
MGFDGESKSWAIQFVIICCFVFDHVLIYVTSQLYHFNFVFHE